MRSLSCLTETVALSYGRTKHRFHVNGSRFSKAPLRSGFASRLRVSAPSAPAASAFASGEMLGVLLLFFASQDVNHLLAGSLRLYSSSD